MNILKKLKLIIPVLFVSFLFSCNDSESSEINKSAPTISVRLVDAPGDYEAVNVEIVDVMIRMDAEGEEDTDDESEWMSLNSESGIVNLLDFTGGFSKVLVEKHTIPTGTLSQIRLVLGDGNTIVLTGEEGEDNKEYDLKTPSAQQSGLKVKIDTPIERGFTYDFILDFDVEKSIVHAGNSDNIILKPVIYASAEATSGIIEGTVSPNNVPAMTKVIVNDPDGDYEVSAYTNESGAFALWGVPAGTYEVMVMPLDVEGDYNGASATDIVVVNGEITTIAEPIVLPLKPGTISGTVSGLAEGVKATVTINDAESTNVETGEGGAYLIDNIQPGNYKVTISATGYVTQEFNITLDPDENEVVDATLELE
ncbi:DUF4382 domain-containing protein [Seonamhaeicola sediminis]|uniref:DUF4382 domain-containing protein n=1 Tax=Seonamhaeicola sediminis TaxID=2528206 RepID=UPI001059966B|nr:DUF4382 domain-containing protein [Seonamhaeicola sediminis]